MRAVYRRAPQQWNLNETAALAAAGFAVVLWGVLPVLRAQAGAVPPLLTTAIALACAALIEVLRGLVTPGEAATDAGARGVPPVRGLLLAALMVGAIGFYFAGLDRAPPARVTLVTYTWPLMFVAASEILTLGRVRGLVLAGCSVAFAGTAALVGGQAEGGAGFAWSQAAGYAAGLASGACWVGYSLALRGGPTLGPGAWPQVFTLAAVLALAAHLALEPAYWPVTPAQLALCAAIGAGPYGLAFVAWAYGLRRGPARTVGALAYAVPFVASGLLIALGSAEASWRLAVGGSAVVLGVALASRAGRTAGGT
jgi:drug/metabolite transporter (DMT)-like permease